MAFLKRLGFYLIGLSVGLIFLAVFLKKKSEETGVQFCYFPNCRVLKELRSKPLAYSEIIQRMVDDGQLDSLDINRFLTEGEVDFKRSSTRTNPCKTYFIEGGQDTGEAILEIMACKEAITIVALTSKNLYPPVE
jgi:hypothetical protein